MTVYNYLELVTLGLNHIIKNYVDYETRV